MTRAGVGPQDLGVAAQSRFADVNGVRLHVVEAGSGPLLLFLHGFPDAWFGWHEAIAEFSRDHRVVCPDLRGYNLSGKPEGVKAYRAAEIVEDLKQLIDQLGGRCTLVAHDWGGAVAWNFAAQYPERLERFVIINAPHPVIFARELEQNPAQQSASDYMLLLRSDGAEAVLSANGYAGVMRHFQDWGNSARPPPPGLMDAYRRAWDVPGALTAMLNWYRASPLRPTPDTSLYATLRERAEMFTVRVPTLVVWGERDPALLPSQLDGLEDYVPDLRIERVPEGSHWVVQECPRAVFGAIRRFLAQSSLRHAPSGPGRTGSPPARG